MVTGIADMDFGLVSLGVIMGSFFGFIALFHLIRQASVYPLLQPKHEITRKEWAIAARMSAVTVLWLAPTIYFSAPFLKAYLEPVDDPLPPAHVTLIKLFVFLLLDDIFFYAYHRFLHSVPFLYKAFHKPHHVFTAPFPLVGFCQHPVEIMLQGIGAMLPFLYPTHPYEFWLYLVLRIYLGIEDHAGMDIWWSPSHWLPAIFGGAKFHDAHHEKFNGNYASVFRFIDDWAGTTLR